MRQYLIIGIMILSTLFMGGCAYNRNPYPKTNLADESWLSNVASSSNSWTDGASRWFFTGEPNRAERMNLNASYSEAISTMMVKVPDFTNINVNGPFQVQIFGTYDHNSVYIYGPNAGVRQAAVAVRGNTLFIRQPPDATCVRNCVIVRIGIRNLHTLTMGGSGTVEGRQLISNGLTISAGGSGNAYLAGNIRVNCIINGGSGRISVFDAVSDKLDIKTSGAGDVNVSGGIGLRSIAHSGSGNVNVIGATSGGMTIFTVGSGKIGLNGQHINIKKIDARDNTCVYAYCLNSDGMYVYVQNNARVGLAGDANNVYVDVGKNSRFYGRYLRAQTAYARAHDQAHANVRAMTRMFGAATDNGSVYFFGSPKIMSQFISGNGVVIPIWYGGQDDAYRYCAYAAKKVPEPEMRGLKDEMYRTQYSRSRATSYPYSARKISKYSHYNVDWSR